MGDEAATELDPNAITLAEDEHEPFTLVPRIQDILRTRYCVPGSIFIVEGIEVVPVSSTGRWRVIRLLLGDGELCIQSVLAGQCHRFVETGEIFVGCYVRLDRFDVEWIEDPDDQGKPSRQDPGAQEARQMVFLVLHDVDKVGWNEGYCAMAKRESAGKDALQMQLQPEEWPTTSTSDVTPSQQTHESISVSGRSRDKASVKSQEPASSYGANDIDMEEAFEDVERFTFPIKNTSPRQAQASPRKPTARAIPTSAFATAAAPTTASASIPAPSLPIALPRDWTNPHQPLKLTTLHAIPHLPYAQNWSCNVLAIVVSLSALEDSYLAPHKQRTARIADPSTAKQVHLTVFLEPQKFEPRVGSAVLLTGVKNHRFDGGSLKKYASDRGKGGQRWWFEDPWELGWCDVAGIKEWWAQMEASQAV